MASDRIKAWHWVGEKLRDGTNLPSNGVKLTHSGEVSLCHSGLHASLRLIDALKYAPGSTLCRVELGGVIVEGKDKLAASERTILWRVDAEEVLREFARKAALTCFDSAVFENKEDKELVRRWLETGDESIRSAAESAARHAAEYATWHAARYAARSAARSAARHAAESATRSAAEYAARSATWCAAESAAENNLNSILLDLIKQRYSKDVS